MSLIHEIQWLKDASEVLRNTGDDHVEQFHRHLLPSEQVFNLPQIQGTDQLGQALTHKLELFLQFGLLLP